MLNHTLETESLSLLNSLLAMAAVALSVSSNRTYSLERVANSNH